MRERLNKRGQLGLDTAKSVMIGFLVIAIIAIAAVLSVTNIRDVAEDFDRSSVTGTAEQTDTVVNSSADAFVDAQSSTARACRLSVTTATLTNGSGIAASNFVITECAIRASSTVGAGYNNSLWNITGTYSFAPSDYNDVSTNISSGVTGFFDDTGTIFSILIVIVIILSIAIIISVVSRFSGGSGLGGDLSSAKTGGASSGKGFFGGSKESKGGASDTVMGV